MKILIISLGRKHVWSLFGTELTEALAKINKETFYIGSSEADNKPEIVNKLMISTGEGKLGNILSTLNIFSYLSIYKYIKKIKPDLIVYPVRHRWLFLLSFFIKKMGIMQYLLIHDATAHPGDESNLDEKIDKSVIENVDGILTLTNYVKEKLLLKYKNKKYITLFHPYYRKYNKIYTDSDDFLKQEKEYVIIFGRIKKYKGIERIAELWSKFNIPRKLVILGSGDDLTTGNSNIIRINKEVSDELLKGYILNSSYVIASHIEASQSGVVAVALGLGVPVLASRAGGIPEQFTDNKEGLLFDINASDGEFLDKINLMEAKHDYFKQNAQVWKASNSFDNFAKKMLDLLK